MNLAFWHMKHSAMLAVKPDLDMEEAKKVHTSLRKAAGNELQLTNYLNLLSMLIFVIKIIESKVLLTILIESHNVI